MKNMKKVLMILALLGLSSSYCASGYSDSRLTLTYLEKQKLIDCAKLIIEQEFNTKYNNPEKKITLGIIALFLELKPKSPSTEEEREYAQICKKLDFYYKKNSILDPKNGLDFIQNLIKEEEEKSLVKYYLGK